MRNALKNRVHAMLARHGVQHGDSDLFGSAGAAFLHELVLRRPPRRRLDSLLALIADFDREIEAITREIDARARRDERVEVLTQIRGVGPYTAMLVIAEVGDVARFASARKLCAWAGLTPYRPLLGWQGPTRPHHPPVLAGPALDDGRGGAEGAARRRPPARGIRADRPPPRAQDAKVAVARKIATLCFYGLREEEIRCLARPCRPSALKVMATS